MGAQISDILWVLIAFLAGCMFGAKHIFYNQGSDSYEWFHGGDPENYYDLQEDGWGEPQDVDSDVVLF